MTIDLNHTFVTSDHHFGSFKLPGFLKVFTEEQEKELIDKWNRTVGKDDLVYYNGDFCDGTVVELCNYAKQLNGRIVLIRGNHERFDDAVYKAVFKDVVDYIALNEIDLTIHHCPGPCLTGREIFGHLHRGTSWINVQKMSTSFCSCVQSNDGFPVLLSKVLEHFKSQTCQANC